MRLTISVTPEVHSTFQRLANAGSMSISRAMGDWLADTLDAVTYTAQKMEQARAAPKLVAREMHSYALGLVDVTSQTIEAVRTGAPVPPAPETPGPSSASAPSGQAAPERRQAPPSSNTGGKVPRRNPKA